jgi:hypothetical protein
MSKTMIPTKTKRPNGKHTRNRSGATNAIDLDALRRFAEGPDDTTNRATLQFADLGRVRLALAAR